LIARACLVLMVLLGCATRSPGPRPEGPPQLDRACSADADCALVNHPTDCCGSLQAIGVAARNLAVSQKLELDYGNALPLCECVSKPLCAEDGRVILDGASVQVRCSDRRCVSSVR
jgi:hypothetical protein